MTGERISEAEYLLRERAAEYRSEFRDGRMVAMTGASRAHNKIVVNLARQLGNRFGDGPCEVYVSDMRVKVRASGLYTYPDVMALCGEPLLEDAYTDTLLNPAVIVEVLSPSTEAYDRGEKFAHYRRLASLREYVLIAQDRMRVERLERDASDSGRWMLTALDEATAVLELPAIGCAVSLREIYRRVTFASPGSSPPVS